MTLAASVISQLIAGAVGIVLGVLLFVLIPHWIWSRRFNRKCQENNQRWEDSMSVILKDYGAAVDKLIRKRKKR